MTWLWLTGLVRRRPGRLAATATGIAIAVALLGVLGTFLSASRATMTTRATAGVAVDWQVQVAPGARPDGVRDLVASAPGTTAALPVGFARTEALAATTPTSRAAPASGTGTQTTGSAIVMGLPPGYLATFPGEVRVLAGRGDGVSLAQQTAANLHAVPGDTVTVARAGLPPAAVVVDGIVALPQADSLFQQVGAPTGAQPSAPPDNVLLLPDVTWRALALPSSVIQVHAARSHVLPDDPAAAYVSVTGAARNLEVRAAGAAVVGDNLAATLDKARSDAAYAQVLFLFLGAPGAVLAGLLTAATAAVGAERRRREQALLRVRGASSSVLVRLAVIEALLVALGGGALGIAAAATIGRLAFGSARFGATPGAAAGWVGAAVAVGVIIAAATVLLPAWRDLRHASVADARAPSGPVTPWWARVGLDVVLLASAGVVFWLTGRGGYQLVLAPEGVPSISVSYWAFAGPALLWLGAGLLVLRLADLALGRGRGLIGRALRPVAGRLAPVAASMASHRRRPLARSVVLLGLALAFAASTASFTSTYQAQAEVDAQLTNGADVTVTEPPGAAVGPSAGAALQGVEGVRAVEPLQHRFAYVGNDLQDLYGVDPATFPRATTFTDQYVQGGSARALLDRLVASPDAILVSAETVADFQLVPGDLVNLRLTDARTGAPITVPFHYAGIVAEFPTAPKDSFLVTNASYVAAATGSDAVGSFLVDTGGQDTAGVAARVGALLGPAATVTDIAATRQQINTSLTAVDLTGLGRVELGFALALAVGAGGLVLALGLAERRRSFAIAVMLGARPAHLRRLSGAEALLVGVGGLIAGAALGWGLSRMLVAVLTGVFDPPPAAVSVPWAYLAVLAVLTGGALAGGVAGATWLARRSAPTILREL